MIKNFVELLDCSVENNKDGIMFEYLSEDFKIQKVTFESFYAQVNSIVDFIKSQNIKNEKIGLCMKNSYQWFAYYYAIVASGNVAVLVPIEAENEAQERMLNNTQTKYLFKSSDYKYNIESVFDVWFDIPETQGKIAACENNIEDLATIVFTSGTTGNEKAVCLSYKNCLFGANSSMAQQSSGNKKDRRMFVLPFAHIGGVNILSLLATGITICILEEPKYFLKSLKIYQPDVVIAVPMYIKLMVKNIIKYGKEAVVGNNLSAISCSSSILNQEDAQKILSNGISLIDVYGLSETTGVGTYKCYIGNTNKTHGGAYDGVCVEIIDGEVVLSGDFVMMGYYNDQNATDEILKNGKIHTGDVGQWEEDGSLRIIGRKKNLIILSNGENISPESIENEISKCQIIKECLVYQKDDKICIDIVLNKESDKEQALTFVEEYNKQISFNKRILGINFVNEIKKNSMGKAKR